MNTETDRELLELAAKAAGIEFDYTIRPDGKSFYHSERNAFATADGGWFAPLTDAGARYRLAKKLDIRIHFGPAYVTYVADGISGVVTWPEDAKDDAYAIVQAAAEIGRAMK